MKAHTLMMKNSLSPKRSITAVPSKKSLDRKSFDRAYKSP